MACVKKYCNTLFSHFIKETQRGKPECMDSFNLFLETFVIYFLRIHNEKLNATL